MKGAKLFKKVRRFYNMIHNKLNVKTISDEYINWLTYANAGMLDRGNIYAMKYAIENLPSNNPVLEIGSFCGLSINVMSYLLMLNNCDNEIINCDRWIFEGAEQGGKMAGSHITHKDYRGFVSASYKRNVEFFSASNKPHTIESYSDELFHAWKNNEIKTDIFNRTVQLGGKISFAYIDGNHTYDFAKRDFENVDRYLDNGGFILFDDSFDANQFGLSKLMNEIKQMDGYKLIMKNPNYLFQKKS